MVTLETQDNAKLLTQLKSGFKRTINWNKNLSKPGLLPQNPNLLFWYLKMIHTGQAVKDIFFPAQK